MKAFNLGSSAAKRREQPHRLSSFTFFDINFPVYLFLFQV